MKGKEGKEGPSAAARAREALRRGVGKARLRTARAVWLDSTPNSHSQHEK